MYGGQYTKKTLYYGETGKQVYTCQTTLTCFFITPFLRGTSVLSLCTGRSTYRAGGHGGCYFVCSFVAILDNRGALCRSKHHRHMLNLPSSCCFLQKKYFHKNSRIEIVQMKELRAQKKIEDMKFGELCCFLCFCTEDTC